jgi:DNA-binding transcriptional MerR regulator
LVSTAVAARELGVARSTLQRWAKAGLVVPELITPGGQYRWDVADLKAQIKAIPPRKERDE